MLLSVKNASVYFGKIAGIHDISIDVAEGQIVALIGANGAGKSTTLESDFRLEPTVNRRDLVRWPAHRPTVSGKGHQKGYRPRP